MESIITKLLEYGPVGVLAVIVGIIAIFIYKLEKRVVKVEDKTESIDGVCIVRKDSFKRVYDRLDILEDEDIKIDGKLANINTNIQNLEANMNNIGDDVKTILRHFAEKGMG